ncbi:MAG: sialate O-acetylesterase [Mucilaginibacter sp.]|uniref:sialate O-acetylesterase n=1 Tax=Mucilaginibacter sp. TaxID=1882438 RepID=UPI00326743E0
MKLKWLLFLGCCLLIINSCKKNPDINIVPQPENGPPVETPTPPFTTEKFSVSNVFQNNMVVQRDKPLLIWGRATTNSKINVTVTWNTGPFVATADQSGDWSVSIPASPVNIDPQTITCKIDDADSTTLTNILIGDVWLCSGQSNMVMQVDALAPFKGVTNYQQEIQAAQYPLIRFQTVQSDYQGNALSAFTYTNLWQVCSPATVGNLSGVSYFFARKLHTSLNVPIGVIVSAINGSYCRDWSNGGIYYNGMINPLLKLSLKGFIWYQGENDQHISPASGYTDLNNQLITYWRSAFKQSSLPFYYVQMTPFAEDYFNTTPPGGDMITDYYAKFREAQSMIRLTPGTGMAVTMDVGEVENHHPSNKKPVGERLALLALKNTYNLNVECVGPQFLSYSQSGNQVTVNYIPGTANGLNAINNGALNQYFFVAGADHVFHRATASISGNTVVLSLSADTPIAIQAVRYAFTSAPLTNLQNSAGLPAEPFRTDTW